ncbi:Copia protein [Araneus ventricosus]|uniref:Copia protein n=1 Tax=Araneus ventricosus TaxID=182803 RepID=A0A4Y2L4X8_ARAVE|nr:Copia protein [Araneus ventricosus]
MEESKEILTPIDANLKLQKCENKSELTKNPYKELLGYLKYIMLGSRPDICFAVNYFSRFQDCASDTYWKRLKRVPSYVKRTIDYELIFKKRGCEEILYGYVDSDCAGDETDRRSTSRYLFKVFDSVASWTTKKQPTVALSSIEAEYIAASSAVIEALWLRNILKDLNCEIKVNVKLYDDNMGCLSLMKNLESKRTKHVNIRYHYIREKVTAKEIELHYIKYQEQLADILTKGLSKQIFEKFYELSGLKKKIKGFL